MEKQKATEGQKQGRQLNGEALTAVQNIHQGEADGGTKEAIQGVQHGIPVGEGDVVGLNLPQNLSSKNKQEDDDLQGVRQINMYLTFKKGGHQKENEGENTEEKVFKVAV